MTDILVRPAFQEDIRWVRAIYMHYVMTSTSTFEITPPTVEDMTARWSKVAGSSLPYLVACAAEDPTRILGFAYASPFREREAYAGTVEDSIYIAPGFERRGIGKALMLHLLRELSEIGVRQVVAGIGGAGENMASIKLHEWAGFHVVGHFQAIGQKFNKPVDVLFMQRGLGPPEEGKRHEAVVTYTIG
jgi:L-amino acid N-acyltransferase YncA